MFLKHFYALYVETEEKHQNVICLSKNSASVECSGTISCHKDQLNLAEPYAKYFSFLGHVVCVITNQLIKASIDFIKKIYMVIVRKNK